MPYDENIIRPLDNRLNKKGGISVLYGNINIFEIENGKLSLLENNITEHLGESVTVIPKCI